MNFEIETEFNKNEISFYIRKKGGFHENRIEKKKMI